MIVSPTTSSIELLDYLKKSGFKLDQEHKHTIHKIVGKAIQDAADWQSNGCDCGQMSCVICHG